MYNLLINIINSVIMLDIKKLQQMAFKIVCCKLATKDNELIEQSFHDTYTALE